MRKWYFRLLYCLVIAAVVFTAVGGSKVVTVISENAPILREKCVIVDAGHGGVDGGATSCTGVLESMINLEIALRLDDLLHLLGVKTRMIRTTDCSVYTKGDTIAAKKVSDLKERVRISNETPNALLVSIHQNYFPQAQYHGAQVFYNAVQGSEILAKQMQLALKNTVNPTSKRQVKRAIGIYLMEKVDCPGILIECGFLSNPQEEAKLRSSQYQMKLCCVMASCISTHLFST